MRESPDDLERLQALLDRSYAAAGAHLRSIHTDAARMDAERLCAELTGMQILVIATVNRHGHPLTGPVDGFFYRGRWHFGTAAEAVRARHVRERPHVSATHVRGEQLTVTVHGRAREVTAAEADGLAEVLREAYEGWDDWSGDAPYFVIEPDRMFAADMSVHTQAAST